ncbi:MAG TPA: class I SAM-dependent methyltransferase [Allosphingosinicella sp.]|jgi:SAM-dependent methyltransferase|nr:class I SAM-dependent methyltransferase [Allosphingosinicella sp.]
MQAIAPTVPSLISDRSVTEAFKRRARALGLDPGDAWVGGYVDYEWKMLGAILRAYRIDLRGLQTLEFGCNYGASSIVMAGLGARVRGVDVDASAVELARCNAARYGRSDIALHHVPDTRRLPFRDGEFDFVLCNSVLEYVRVGDLPEIVRELHRVMKPGGRLLVTGTSSRLSPREIHSGRWLVNYLPRGLDRRIGRNWQRGLSPFLLHRLVRSGFSDEDAADGGRGWASARAAMRGGDTPPFAVRAVAAAARLLGLGPGWLTPNLSVMLKRR